MLPMTLRHRNLWLLLPLATPLALATCVRGEAETPAAEEGRRREPKWLSGRIMGVDHIPIDQYNESTVHLIITTEGEDNVRLKLGPGWYLEQQGLSFKPQQHIEYKAKPDPSDGTLVVHRLRHKEQTIDLRDANGNPLWPRGGRLTLSIPSFTAAQSSAPPLLSATPLGSAIPENSAPPTTALPTTSMAPATNPAPAQTAPTPTSTAPHR